MKMTQMSKDLNVSMMRNYLLDMMEDIGATATRLRDAEQDCDPDWEEISDWMRSVENSARAAGLIASEAEPPPKE
jgi:hypothetical protein